MREAGIQCSQVLEENCPGSGLWSDGGRRGAFFKQCVREGAFEQTQEAKEGSQVAGWWRALPVQRPQCRNILGPSEEPQGAAPRGEEVAGLDRQDLLAPEQFAVHSRCMGSLWRVLSRVIGSDLRFKRCSLAARVDQIYSIASGSYGHCGVFVITAPSVPLLLLSSGGNQPPASPR